MNFQITPVRQRGFVVSCHRDSSSRGSFLVRGSGRHSGKKSEGEKKKMEEARCRRVAWRRADPWHDRSAEVSFISTGGAWNFNGQNLFLYVPHINKKVAQVKNLKASSLPPLSPRLDLSLRSEARRGRERCCATDLSAIFVYYQPLPPPPVERSAARFRVASADLQKPINTKPRLMAFQFLALGPDFSDLRGRPDFPRLAKAEQIIRTNRDSLEELRACWQLTNSFN